MKKSLFIDKIMNENNKEKKYVCQFNEKHILKSQNGKTNHEIFCPDNPHKEKANNIKKKMKGPRPNILGEKHPMYGVHRYGKNAPFYGNKHSDESRQLISDNQPDFSGDKHPNFGKRNETTLVWNDWIYGRMHRTIRQLKPKPECCETCKKKIKRLHYSYNLPHFEKNPLYYSLNPNHYTWRCASCHERYDLNAFWSKWNENRIQEYSKNLKILKKKWPHKIEKDILKKLDR